MTEFGQGALTISIALDRLAKGWRIFFAFLLTWVNDDSVIP